MHIETLEVPTPAPVAIGSSPSPEAMSTSDPGVVTVDANGNLVAHRNGRATIRAASGGTLRVFVDP